MINFSILILTGQIELVLFVLLLICSPFMLWTDYTSIMSFKRVRNLHNQRLSPALSKLQTIGGTYILIRGYLLDFLVNAIHASIILLEFPKELTVTARLDRHITQNTKHAALCLSIRTNLLDNIDPDGIHK